MIKSINRTLSFLSKKEKHYYFALLIARSLSSVLDILGIALIGLLTAVAAGQFKSENNFQVLGFSIDFGSEDFILLLVCLVLVVFVVKAVIAVFLIRRLNHFLARVESAKAVEIAEYLLSGQESKNKKWSKSKILWGILGSCSTAFSGMLSSFSTIVSEGVLLILVAITFFVVDPVAAIFVFGYFAMIILIIQFVIGNSLKKAGNNAAYGNMKVTQTVEDYLGTIKEIFVFGREEYFINALADARGRLSMSFATMNFLGGMPRYVVETALMLGVVIFVGWQFLTGQLSDGLVTVGVFLTGGVRIMASLLPLQNSAANIKNQTEQSKVSLDLLEEIKGNTQKAEEKETSSADQENNEAKIPIGVKLNDIHFSYPDNKDVTSLENISINIEPGQQVAFIGPSGAGKTTLADIILGVLKPTLGNVVLYSEEDGPVSRSSIAYVPQRPGIVTGSIAENVALGVDPQEIDFNKVEEVLEMSALSEYVSTLPEGIHSDVGNQSGKLSGGQIQRLGLARALYISPSLLVLDEATSALDALSESLISRTIERLRPSTTVVTIAHRLSTIQHADTVFFVENGKLIAQGSFQHLVNTEPKVAEYVELMKVKSDEN